ncbi:MAG: ATPase, T2SS/T4P/T4SS family [Phocaeicola sp.]
MAVRRNTKNKAILDNLEEMALKNQEAVLKSPDKKLPIDIESNPELFKSEKSKNSDSNITKKLVKDDLAIALKSFDSIITKSYLENLSECKIEQCQAKSVPNMRWIKINEIVYEKDEFFVDKLSKLYNAIHSSARNVCFMLRRGYNDLNKSAVEIFIGTTDADENSYNNISADILQRGLKGLFPGVSSEVSHDVVSEMKNAMIGDIAISCVSGVASLIKDDKKNHFIQGLEKLIDSSTGLKFCVYFIAEKIKNKECASILSNYENLHSALTPMGEIQLSFSQNETKGINQTTSETFTKTVGFSLSNTITKGTSVSNADSRTNGSSLTETETEGTADTSNAIVFSHSDNYSESISRSMQESTTETVTKSENEARSNQESTTNSDAIGTQKGQGWHSDRQNGFSQQITLRDRKLRHYQDILDNEIERLQNAQPFGLWSMATYFISEDITTATALASLYKGCIVGDESNSQVFSINNWSREYSQIKEISKYLLASQHPLFILPNGIKATSGSLVSSKELAIHMSLPQRSVPGILVREEVPFGHEVVKHHQIDNSEAIELGKILHLGEEFKLSVNLCLSELTKHMFVTGSTGSGKSNTMYLILSQLKQQGIKFMVVEPAKGEYKHVFGNSSDVTVYSNSPKCGKLLQINPFAFPYKSIDILEHVDRLVEIFNACWPMYAAMPSVLKKSIITAYKKCGWDLLLSENKYSQNNRPIFPTIDDILVCLKDYINNSEYSNETKGDYKGALETRLSDLNVGIIGLMLSGEPIEDEELFNENIIIDLSRIGSTETKSLLMGFLVMKLNEFRMSEGGMNKPLKHVTVLEEAHNLLKKTSSEQNQESSNLVGKSVEMISNSIAEMRTYGEGFIIVDQSPALLDSSAIRNTNTKIVMSLPENMDRQIAGKSIALTDDQINQIAKLNVGEAIVYQNNWEIAVQCKIDEYKYNKGIIYTSTYPMPKTEDRIARVEIIDFLLAKLTNKDFEFEKVSEFMNHDTMPSSVRISLLSLMTELRETKKLSIWERKNFSQLMEIVFKYLDIDGDVIKLKGQIVSIKDIAKYRRCFDELLKDKISGDVDRATLFFIEQGYSKKMRPDYYEQWKETFKIY